MAETEIIQYRKLTTTALVRAEVEDERYSTNQQKDLGDLWPEKRNAAGIPPEDGIFLGNIRVKNAGINWEPDSWFSASHQKIQV